MNAFKTALIALAALCGTLRALEVSTDPPEPGQWSSNTGAIDSQMAENDCPCIGFGSMSNNAMTARLEATLDSDTFKTFMSDRALFIYGTTGGSPADKKAFDWCNPKSGNAPYMRLYGVGVNVKLSVYSIMNASADADKRAEKLIEKITRYLPLAVDDAIQDPGTGRWITDLDAALYFDKEEYTPVIGFAYMSNNAASARLDEALEATPFTAFMNDSGAYFLKGASGDPDRAIFNWANPGSGSAPYLRIYWTKATGGVVDKRISLYSLLTGEPDPYARSQKLVSLVNSYLGGYEPSNLTDAFDPNETFAEAHTLPLAQTNRTFNASLRGTDRVDWYRFAPPATPNRAVCLFQFGKKQTSDNLSGLTATLYAVTNTPGTLIVPASPVTNSLAVIQQAGEPLYMLVDRGANTGTEYTLAGSQKVNTMTASPNPVAQGAEITYTINYVNVTESTQNKITVTNTLPANVTFLESDTPPVFTNAFGLIWEIPTYLAKGESGSISFKARVGAAAQTDSYLTNTAEIVFGNEREIVQCRNRVGTSAATSAVSFSSGTRIASSLSMPFLYAIPVTGGSAQGPASVGYRVKADGGNAVRGTDFSVVGPAPLGELSWPNGPGTTNILVEIYASAVGKVFTLALENPVGQTLGSPAECQVTIENAGGSPMPLDRAVNNATLAWSTGGSAKWSGLAQTPEGGSAAVSGAMKENQEGYLQTTARGDCVITFSVKVDDSAGDSILELLDGNLVVANWRNQRKQTVSIPLAGGSHTLRWRFRQGSSPSARSYIGNVIYQPEGATLHHVDIAQNDPNGGTVTGGGHYPAGTQATLTAIPAKGWQFEAWSTGSRTARQTFTVTQDLAITARFSPIPYVRGIASQGGKVTGSAYCPAGRKVTLKATPERGCAFTAWDDGLQTPTRTVVSPQANQTFTASFKPIGEIAPPAIAAIADCGAMVGIPFTLPIGVASETLPAVTVRGLPGGLKFSQGIISGIPAKAGAFTITVNASNATQKRATSAFRITVAPLPDFATGTFSGLADFNAAALGARIDLTVSKLGAVSGSIRCETGRHTFKAAFASPYAIAAEINRGKTYPPLALTLSFGESAVTGTLGEGEATLWQDRITLAPTAFTPFAGIYNVTLGGAYFQVTLNAKKSIAALAGRFPDGKTFSASAPVVPESDTACFIPLWIADSKYKAALTGILRVEDGIIANTEEEPLTWKPAGNLFFPYGQRYTPRNDSIGNLFGAYSQFGMLLPTAETWFTVAKGKIAPSGSQTLAVNPRTGLFEAKIRVGGTFVRAYGPLIPYIELGWSENEDFYLIGQGLTAEGDAASLVLFHIPDTSGSEDSGWDGWDGWGCESYTLIPDFEPEIETE